MALGLGGMQKIGLAAVLEMTNFNQGKEAYTSGITQMEGKTSGFAGKLSGLGGKIGAFAGTVAKAAAAGLAAGAAALGGLAIGVGKLAMEAAPLEGIGQAFEAMAGKVGLSIDDLKTASKGMISDFDLMKAANLALVGAGEQLGQEFGEKLPALLKIAQASARATGEDAGFLFESLVKGIKRSSPMLIDNTGLQLKLGEANAKLAEQLGKSVDELSAEEKQIALLNATLEAGQVMVDDFGGGQLTAAERMAQFKAQIQNTKDQIGLAFLPALQAVMVPLGDLAQKVGPMVVEWAKQAATWLGENIPIAMQAIADLWTSTLQPALQGIWSFIQNNLIPVFQSVITWFQNMVGSGEQAAGWFSSSLLPVFQTVVGWFQENWPKIQAIFEQVWGAVQKVVQGVLDRVVPFIVERFQQVVGWVQANWPLIQNTITTVLDAVLAVVQTVLSAISQFWQDHGARIMTIVNTVWDTIKTVISTTIETVQGIIKAIMQVITGDWEGAWLTIQTTLGNVWEAIKRIISNAVTVVYQTIALVWETIQPRLKEAWEAIKRTATDVWEGIKEAVDKAIQDIVQFVKDLPQKAVQAIKAGYGALKEVGKGLVDSIKQGIQDAWGSFIAWIVSKAGEIWQEIKKALGFGSPSKPMMELGTGVVQSLGLGMLKGEGSLMKMAQKAVSGIGTMGVTVPMYGTPGLAAAAAGPVTNNNVTVSMANTISSELEMGAFEARVEQVVRRAVRGY